MQMPVSCRQSSYVVDFTQTLNTDHFTQTKQTRIAIRTVKMHMLNYHSKKLADEYIMCNIYSGGTWTDDRQ